MHKLDVVGISCHGCAMYDDARTAVRTVYSNIEVSEVGVGRDQGSRLSYLLFSIVMEALSMEFQVDLFWKLLYANGSES